MFQLLFGEYRILCGLYRFLNTKVNLKIDWKQYRTKVKYERARKRVLEEYQYMSDKEVCKFVYQNEKYCSSSSEEDNDSEERMDEYKRRIAGYDEKEWEELKGKCIDWEKPPPGFKPHRMTGRMVPLHKKVKED